VIRGQRLCPDGKLFLMRMCFVFAALLGEAASSWAKGVPMRLQTSSGTLSGTLELPANPRARVPVALLLSGSGPTDRDGDAGSIGGASLRLLAEGLAKQGIASLRFDKRGVGESASAAPSESDLRFETYIADATSWGQKLKRDRRFGTLTVVGHSEGALIGAVAAQRLKADSYVSLEGAGRPAAEVLRAQLRPALPAPLWAQSQRILAALERGKTDAQVPAPLAALFRPSVQPYLISWFRFDPAREIKALRIPVLLVQGTTDLQVGLEDARRLQSANSKAQLLEISGMNHVLKQAGGNLAAQMKAYSDPSLPLSPRLVESLSRFILTNGRS